MNDKRILKWEIAGFILISALGTALHFCFEWSGGFTPLALFCAVNESVWEHCKMGFWPAFFYAMIEYFYFGKKNNNFIFAKCGALYIIPLTIILIYYALQAIFVDHSLWVDIALFYTAILLSQLFSYRIITSNKDYSPYNTYSLILIVLLTLAFSLFTFNPPKLDIFKDSQSNSYGITNKK